MFHGKIIRDQSGEQTLKQLKITNHTQIVIQVLQEPELLEANDMIVLVCKRNVLEKKYGPKIEVKFRFTAKPFPNIPELISACKEQLGIALDQSVSLAKYVPDHFEWRHLDPAQEITETQGKKKKTVIKTLAAEFDLRKHPFMMSDGDIIGLRVDSEEGAATDDFQTEADASAREEFKVLQEKERAEKEKDNLLGKKQKRQEAGGIVFMTDF